MSEPRRVSENDVGHEPPNVRLGGTRIHRQLDAYTYTIGLIGLALLLLPIVPGIGETISGARSARSTVSNPSTASPQGSRLRER